MRWLCAMLAMVAAVSAAEAQLAWVGVGTGMSWEWRPDSEPGRDWATRKQGTPAVFVGLPIDRETMFRLRATQLPFDAVVEGEVARARFRAYTAGVDYFMTGVFGEAVFSGGVGAYRLEFTGADAVPGSDSTRFGWYVGVGEWFPVSDRMKITAEVLYHRIHHQGKPAILAATVGVAFSI